jgi:hypothetical protein
VRLVPGMTTVREVLARQPESAFQRQVIEYAQLRGWRVAHFRSVLVQHKDGRASTWQTPVQADGAGFPDLIMVRDGRLIVAELKAERGEMTAEQVAWMEAFATLSLDSDGGCEPHLWCPSDWPIIEKVLA